MVSVVSVSNMDINTLTKLLPRQANKQRRVQGEKESVLDTIRSLRRDIKLKDALIAAYVPPAQQETIMRHAHWDEYAAVWSIDAAELAGNSVRQHRDVAAAQAAHLRDDAGAHRAPSRRRRHAGRARALRGKCAPCRRCRHCNNTGVAWRGRCAPPWRCHHSARQPRPATSPICPRTTSAGKCCLLLAQYVSCA